MKRLILLLVLGVVGCGQQGHPAAVKASPPTLKEMDAYIQKDDNGSVISITLASTKVTDAGLVHLKGLKSLEELYLGNTQVTDAGLVYLEELASLADLSLTSTQVTDAGLVHLMGLKSLWILDLHGTQVTDTGLEHLKKALPKCDIKK
jgi:hypothetical protein